MRATLACLVAVPATVVPLASAGPERPHPARVSWADARHLHGWAPMLASHRGGWCPSRFAVPRICATDDGGKHWRGILYGAFTRVRFFARSTKKAGIAVLPFPSRDSTYAVATIDEGRHWYSIEPFASGASLAGADRIWARQSRIYWREGMNVYRLGGWPPVKARGSCAGEGHTWASGIHARGPRRNVCWMVTTFGAFPAGRITGIKSVLIKAPDTSISSWADKKHAFATDPAGAKWRCAPPGARDYVVTLCGTDNGGKNWWIAYSQEWKRGLFDSLVTIFGVWRGPAPDGAFDLAYEVEGNGGDTVYVTHDGGRDWVENDAFFDGMKHACSHEEPDGTVCAGGVHFHQVHGKPLQLVYDLSVCTAPFTAPCEKRTYRMDGWPDGTLEPVLLTPAQ